MGQASAEASVKSSKFKELILSIITGHVLFASAVNQPLCIDHSTQRGSFEASGYHMWIGGSSEPIILRR